VTAFDATPWLVFARAAGLVARAPGFSHPSVPHVVRAGISAALAFAVAPSVARAPQLPFAAFTLALAAETALGAAIGFGASLLYDGAYFAGRTIDDYLGVRGSVPGANVANAQAFGRLWSSLFLVALLVLDGWVPIVDAFAASFAHVAPGVFPARTDWLRYALALPQTLVLAALLVALPVIAVAASVHLAFAAVMRVVPRLSSMSLTFPAVFAAALLVTLAAVPSLAPAGARPWLVLPWSGAR
jgi:flagellar biosynthesis protein FliR